MKTIIKMILIFTAAMFTTSGINNSVITKVNINEGAFAESNQEEVVEPEIVYDGLTLDELAAKLDRNLNSNISGYGMVFATKSLDLGLDPYLAVSIMLLETGCKWNCSYLMRECNNVGGMKGNPGCAGGSYKRFDTLEEGIDAFLNNLYYNYYAKGYTTPEQIGVRYAESKTWPSKVNYYINEIKNS